MPHTWTENSTQNLNPKDLLEVWVDASFYGPHKVAGAAVVTNHDGKRPRVFGFDLQSRTVNTSSEAEIWAAITILELITPGYVKRLVTDCSTVETFLRKYHSNDFSGKWNFRYDLFNALEKIVPRHPSLQIEQKRRTQGKIPVAHDFAKALASGNSRKLESAKRKHKTLPFREIHLLAPDNVSIYPFSADTQNISSVCAL